MANSSKVSKLKKIGTAAFNWCCRLQSVHLPDGLEEIGLWAFASSGLETLTTPQSVKTIRQGAFCWCKRLRDATLNEGLETLGSKENRQRQEHWYGIFEESGLQSVKLPSTLKVIEHSAFRGCKCLKKITLPKGLEQIGQTSFASSGLENVALPKSLRSIDQGAFFMCKALKAIALNEGLEMLDTDVAGENGKVRFGVFQDSALESVKVPSTVKKIGASAFSRCKNLKRVKFEEGIESLGDREGKSGECDRLFEFS